MKKRLLLALGLLAFGPYSATAAVIVSTGSALNDPNWVSQGYGTDAYFFFASSESIPVQNSDIGLGLIAGGSDRSSFLPKLAASTGVYNSNNANRFTYAAIQAPSGVGTIPTGVAMRSALNDDNLVNLVTFTFSSDIGDTYRVGVLIANNFDNDATLNPGTLRLTIGSESVDTSIIRPANTTAQADWYFFNVSGLTDGDSLTIASNRYSGDSPAKIAGISGVTFSAAAIPEPSTVAMTLALLAGAALFRRRSSRSA